LELLGLPLVVGANTISRPHQSTFEPSIEPFQGSVASVVLNQYLFDFPIFETLDTAFYRLVTVAANVIEHFADERLDTRQIGLAAPLQALERGGKVGGTLDRRGQCATRLAHVQ